MLIVSKMIKRFNSLMAGISSTIFWITSKCKRVKLAFYTNSTDKMGRNKWWWQIMMHWCKFDWRWCTMSKKSLVMLRFHSNRRDRLHFSANYVWQFKCNFGGYINHQIIWKMTCLPVNEITWQSIAIGSQLMNDYSSLFGARAGNERSFVIRTNVRNMFVAKIEKLFKNVLPIGISILLKKLKVNIFF